MHGEQHAERATSQDAWRAARGACDQPLKTFYFVSGAQVIVMAAFHLLMKRIVFRGALDTQNEKALGDFCMVTTSIVG
jgi:hypothetical protein